MRTAYYGFLLIVGLTFLALSSFAQSLHVAELDDQGVIQLPSNQPVANTYVFDASDMSFENDAALFRFFDGLNNDVFLIRVNPETMEGRLMLRAKNRSAWDVEQWNNALRERCEARPIRNQH